MSGFSESSAAHGAGALLIALIGPDTKRRKAVARALTGSQGGKTASDAPTPVKASTDFTLPDRNNGPKTYEEPFLLHKIDGTSSTVANPAHIPQPNEYSFERILLNEVKEIEVTEQSMFPSAAGEAPPVQLDSFHSVNAGSSARSTAVTEFSSYPVDLDLPSQILGQHFDVVIVDLDSDPEYALRVVKSIADDTSVTVMIYSALADRDMVVRCMRAGAREFLALPLSSNDMADALARVTVRRPSSVSGPIALAKVLVFLGSKGGCGVTTIASNFAVSLAQESGQKTLLIDLGLPLGDVAINLGMVTDYSTFNAFHDSSRLDANFLSSLLARHSSGLSVLAAPSDFPNLQPSMEAVDKLLTVARQNFDFVVVDLGSRLDLKESALFEPSTTFFLVTQVGISELRNANRLITRFLGSRDRDLQIVLNRYTSRTLLFDEAHIVKALTRAAEWRIPDDYATARRTRNTANPLALVDSPISITIRQMARKASGLPESIEKKRGFSLFGRAT